MENLENYFDVVIIGAGPAGLFAAYELSKYDKLKTLVIDKGKDVLDRYCAADKLKKCIKCEPCQIMYGVGGAGGLSDGTLNLRPDIGGNLFDLTDDENYAWQLIFEVDKIFLTHGGPKKLSKGSFEKIKSLQRRSAQNGVRFIPIIQRHIGSDHTKHLINNIKNTLQNRGISFLLNTEVLEFEKNKVFVNNFGKGELIKTKYIIVAPGRGNADWFLKISEKIGLKANHGPIDVGVRVEVPSIIMESITEINHDPKFHIYTNTYDDFVRTFCTNPYGFVVEENYGDIVGVNGHSMADKKSENTNFSFLTRIELTEPVENTTSYGKSIAKLTTTLGGGKPLLQRLGDLKRGRRSTWDRLKKSSFDPTLKQITPGDIAMALPHRIVTNIIEGLEKLDKVIPGVSDDHTLLYAPEIKYYAMKTNVNSDLETSVSDIFVAGDGAGLSRDVTNACATGILAARGILKKEGFEDTFNDESANWQDKIETME
ncbi:FAD dependent oxidoreductase [Methanococcus maripaludis C5]|uniref:FAD dependent oxidoreductase n=1 Tax=Methanococcus maripaludis (strain C5 / ATCC BAA-1333) TaxID=402880 RepID=A4FXC0_METM5|nr:NAD(P)/FAD-dependent oxidoreductase [Methanococcus maripaludis]ABO34849.1 FAD dependent oxidoreductase [Methanococcus maripaludis C5]